MRRYGRHYMLAAALILVAAMLPVMLILVVVWPHGNTGSGQHHRFSTPVPATQPSFTMEGVLAGTAFIITFTLPLSYAACRTGKKAFTRCKLWESGVSVYRLGKELKSMKYADCKDFKYHTRRSYVKGLYAGSTVTVVFRTDQTKIGFDVPFKEKPVGMSWSILGRTFKCDDELELVKAIVSHAMADAWMSSGGSSREFNWSDRMTLTPHQLTPKRGRHQGRPFRPGDISKITFDRGYARVLEKDNPKAIVEVWHERTNFWPGLEIARRIVPQSHQ